MIEADNACLFPFPYMGDLPNCRFSGWESERMEQGGAGELSLETRAGKEFEAEMF